MTSPQAHYQTIRSFSTEIFATEESMPLSETMRRVLSLDNASQEEKNLFRLREVLKEYQIHPTDTGNLRAGGH